jgi:hypothetical protein
LNVGLEILLLNINREGDGDNMSEKNEKVINLKDKIVGGSKKTVDAALNAINPITNLGKDFFKNLRYDRGLDSKDFQVMMNKAETKEERQQIRDFELKKSKGRNLTMLGGIILLGVIGLRAHTISEKFSQPSVN